MKYIITWTALFVALATLAIAAVPQTINYQGYLKNTDGTPVTTQKSIVFSFYSSNPARNNPVWHETQSVTPQNGVYSVQLGAVQQLAVTFEVPYHLGVKVGTDSEMALQPLSVVPYAVRAAMVNSVSGTAIADGSITPLKLDTAYVNKAGDSMGGSLSLPANGLSVGTTQFVASGQRIGIGTATPRYPLDVVSPMPATDTPAVYGENAATDYIGIGVKGKGGWIGVDGQVSGTGSRAYHAVRGISSTTNAAGTTMGGFFTASGGADNYGIYANADKNYFSGNIGLGTFTPGAKLHIKGNGYPNSFIHLDTTAAVQDSGIRFYENGSVKSHLFWSGSDQTLKIYGNNGYAGIDITPAGAVGIGTSAPTAALQVVSSGVAFKAGDSSQGITVNTASGGTILEMFSFGNLDFIDGWTNSLFGPSRAFIIDKNGVYAQGSDLRLKTDILPLEDALAKVMNLRGVSYMMKADETRERKIGVIAQELEQEYPELVATDNQGIKSVAYANLTAVLIEAVKGLKAENETLKGRLERLEYMLGTVKP